MKKTTLVAAILMGSAVASSLLAQGTIVWGNVFGTTFRAPIYGIDPTAPGVRKSGNPAVGGLPVGTQTYGGALLAGTGFTMAIYAGTTASEAMASLTPLANGTSTFLTAAGAGFMNQRTATDPNHPPGTTDVNVQLRAWDNQMGSITSWADVLARQGTVAGGSSDVFTVGALGGGAITPPQTIGLRSFQLTQVPEPSLIALGALGLGALLLRRRK
jgi:hypothetical protein